MHILRKSTDLSHLTRLTASLPAVSPCKKDRSLPFIRQTDHLNLTLPKDTRFHYREQRLRAMQSATDCHVLCPIA